MFLFRQAQANLQKVDSVHCVSTLASLSISQRRTKAKQAEAQEADPNVSEMPLSDWFDHRRGNGAEVVSCCTPLHRAGFRRLCGIHLSPAATPVPEDVGQKASQPT